MGIIFEVVMLMARQVVRSLKHHDESAGPMWMCLAMAIKKCIGRYVCFLILDPTLATVAAVLLAVFEFASAAQSRNRDAFFLRAQLCGVDDKPAVVNDVMKHPRNALMRVRNAHNETVLEICFSTTALILILAYRVSLDGHGLPATETLLRNFFVQWTTENVVDLLIITWLTVMARQPVLATEHRLFKGWTYVISVLVLFGNGFVLTTTVIEDTYAHIATGVENGPRWYLLTHEVQRQLVNTTALCQMFGASEYCE